MNRVDRLFATVLFLQSKRVTTAEEISAHFGLSVRTVYRDLAALAEAGVPVRAEAGVGYSLMRGYFLPPVSFSPEEASALATGCALVESLTDESLAGPIRSALLKVRSVLPVEMRSKIERLAVGLYVDSMPIWQTEHLIQLQRAIMESRAVRLCYRTSDDASTERMVEPLGLTHYLENWHLIAWCRLRSDYRDFRVNRIESLALLNERVHPRPDFSLAAHMEQAAKACDETVAKVHFSSSTVDRAKRQWAFGVRGITPDAGPNHGATLTLAATDLRWLAGWLLSFGAHATVIEPPRLREIIAEQAREALGHHGGEGLGL